jgi:hypothetical protein
MVSGRLMRRASAVGNGGDEGTTRPGAALQFRRDWFHEGTIVALSG